jgi:hypothetical protein
MLLRMATSASRWAFVIASASRRLDVGTISLTPAP